jgi:hypothetical protein
MKSTTFLEFKKAAIDALMDSPKTGKELARHTNPRGPKSFGNWLKKLIDNGDIIKCGDLYHIGDRHHIQC